MIFLTNFTENIFRNHEQNKITHPAFKHLTRLVDC